MNLKIKRGFDLRLAGAPEISQTVMPLLPAMVAITPEDFPGFIPKVDVEAGQQIKAGSAIAHHKHDENIRLVSPVAGSVVEIVRGQRRKVLRITIKPDIEHIDESILFEFDKTSKDSTMTALAQSGLLAMMRQRPFDIVPSTNTLPRDIFVTLFDSAPLAENEYFSDIDAQYATAAVALLDTLTTGKVYLSRRINQAVPDIPGAVMVDVQGPHPAGLAGIQAENIRPVNKGEVIWTMDRNTLVRVGMLAKHGKVQWQQCIAVVGSSVKYPYIAHTYCGIDVATLLHDHLPEDTSHLRIVSGNILVGQKVGLDGYMHWPYTQLTVIPEGDDVDQFMGWASLAPGNISISPSFAGSWLKKVFSPDARMRGGRRAMIMSGEYERALPMDIMLEYLIKAINAEDIDNMERLGIYEIAPEDVALAEFADSSKQPLQNIIRKGIELMRRETE